MVYFPVFIFLLLTCSCKSEDQLTHERPLSPGEMLVSENGIFAMGFFSPASSNRSLYVGIWFHNLSNSDSSRTIVWVANRNSPATTASSPILAISNSSDLVLSDSNGRTLWATQNNVVVAGAGRATAMLRDSGNFVLRSPNGTVIWQSFDHPTDTILHGMSLLLIHRGRGDAGRLVAWRGPDDPSSGEFSFGLDPVSNLELVIWHGTTPYCRIIVWNGVSVSGGMYASGSSSIVYQTIVNTGDEFYLVFTVSDGSPYTRITLDHTGTMKLLSWNSNSSSWAVVSERPKGRYGLYDSCGPNGYCDFTSDQPACQCLEGFEPRDANSSKGCRRTEELRCSKRNHFVALPGMRVPDNFVLLRNRSFEQCAAECSRNCSCTAYAYANLSSTGTMGDQSRCLVWTGELVDTWKSTNYGEKLYLRLADPSPVEKKIKLLKILLPIISCVLLLAFVALVWTCKNRGTRQKKKAHKRMMLEYLRTTDEAWDNNIEFPFITFEDIVAATDNFSDSNMLGKGGFGKVYKGMLEDSKEVAIKRLSKGSGQGTEEFRNEVVLIAKLQHKNLVKLLGCCIHEDEKLLVYEYLPNKSLDQFLFDSATKSMLSWPTRFKIIHGIARGLMYLHHDSRLTIIHRDLKAGNILLDKEMSPKISDFGMAKIFSGDQLEANTNRVVGTYGYMSPEYAMEGAFSVKSDTYSFGVLLLEIVSGLKISSPHLIMDFPNLIVYAWNLWKDGKTEDLVDSSVNNDCSIDEVSRCIHIGLLCVQDNPDCRPLMSAVVFMLENRTTPLPFPMQPVYFARRDARPGQASDNRVFSVNNMSLTAIEGR